MSKYSSEEMERRSEIVVKDFKGIIPFHEIFYLHSIKYSAERALESFRKYDRLREGDSNPEELISIIQEAVGHAAALSRYFWPSPQGKRNEPFQRKQKEIRGEKLREAFKIENSSSLYNRSLRNAWEHFDERLDSYLMEQDSGYFFPGCMIESHSLADEPMGHIFKLLDPDAECLVLMNKKYFFSPIRRDVENIYKKAIEFSNNGGRL